jgi:ribosomal protein S6
LGVKKDNSNQSKPILFSDHFNVDKKKMEEFGVFNPILNCDTKLFVEPLLLKSSQSSIIKESYEVFINFFAELLLLIKSSKITDDSDIHWREARRRVKFPEYKSTCIGYGSGTTSGGGAGRELNEKILKNAKDIIASGQENPKMFTILPFLEEGIGGDIISDMVQKIINNQICQYTVDVLDKIGLKGDYKYTTEEGISYNLLFNPFSKCELKFLPQDILTNLPIADSFDNWIVGLSQKNFELRKQINKVIGEAWLEKNKAEKKEDILSELKSNRAFFLEVVKIITNENFDHYNLKEDHQGIYRWFEDAKSIISQNNLAISSIVKNDQESLDKAVLEIISNFKNLIENKNIWRLFWTKRNTKMYHTNEFYSQMLFFMSSQMWLEAQNSLIVLNREFSFEDKQLCLIFLLGRNTKTIVQFKHANNGSLAKMYERQIEFCQSKKLSGFYVVMNFKEDNANQYDQIKKSENSNCKIIKIDVIEEDKNQAEFDFDLPEIDIDLKDFYIEFEDMPSDGGLYLAEKRKGGLNSHKQNHPLKNKVQELCKKELKIKNYSSANQLCDQIAKQVEKNHKDLLLEFAPYQIYLNDGGFWTKGTFYNWCNDIFKQFK